MLRAKWTSAVGDPGGNNSVGTLYLWWAGEWCGDGGGGVLGDGVRYGECQLAQVILSSEKDAVKRANGWFGFNPPMRRVAAEELEEQVADEIVPLDLAAGSCATERRCNPRRERVDLGGGTAYRSGKKRCHLHRRIQNI